MSQDLSLLNGNTLAATLSLLSARDQVSARVVCKRWHTQSRSAAGMALSRYLPAEVISTLALPLQTLRCFERLFYDEMEHYKSSASSCKRLKLRYTYMHSSLALDLLCFPYKDVKRNTTLLEKITTQSNYQKIKIIETVISLHNIHLYQALITNVVNFRSDLFMSVAYASGNLRAFTQEYHCHDAHELDMSSELARDLRFISHPSIISLILNHIDSPDMLLQKIKHLSDNPTIIYAAKDQAERIFSGLKAMEIAWKENDGMDAIDFYMGLQEQDVRRARVALFLSGDVDLVREMISLDAADCRSDRQYNELETRLMILFAIYHNDKCLFDTLINNFPEVVRSLKQDDIIFFQAISLFRSWNILPWVNDQCDTIFVHEKFRVPFCLVILHPFIAKRVIEKWLCNDPCYIRELNYEACAWGNPRILRLVFSKNNLPDQGGLNRALLSGNVNAVKVLLEINPQLIFYPTDLYTAAYFNNIPLLKFLIEYGFQPDKLAFDIAVHAYACDVVEYLAKHHELLPDPKTLQIIRLEGREIVRIEGRESIGDLLTGEQMEIFEPLWRSTNGAPPTFLYTRQSMIELIENLSPPAEAQSAMTT